MVILRDSSAASIAASSPKTLLNVTTSSAIPFAICQSFIAAVCNVADGKRAAEVEKEKHLSSSPKEVPVMLSDYRPLA